MVNASFNFASLAGLACIAWAGVVEFKRRKMYIKAVLLFASGIILLFQGWRLDPVLQIAYFFLASAIFVTGKEAKVIDIFNNAVDKSLDFGSPKGNTAPRLTSSSDSEKAENETPPSV